MRQTAGYILLIIGGLIVMLVSIKNIGIKTKTNPFSPYTLLNASWTNYKQKFINEDGRVIDFTQDDTTTSEGQSYALLRAVFVDDREEFDRVWKWTKENLKRPNDYLFSWKWGLRNDGRYGVMDLGGENSASDADSDIALALIMAGRRWGDEKYKEEAKLILKDLWEINTDTAGGSRYLLAGNWAKNSEEIIVNPSYFAPYAWRIFSEIDRERDWNSLIDPAYSLLEDSGRQPLDKEKGVGLPPDWIKLNKETGQILVPTESMTTNYTYDAMRVPFRIGLDYVWNKDERAYRYLEKSYTRLEEDYEKQGKLAATYSHNGEPLGDYESPVMYSTALAYFMVSNPDLGKKVYEEKILRLYSTDSDGFRAELPYYEQNWLWFGAALYNQYLNKF